MPPRVVARDSGEVGQPVRAHVTADRLFPVHGAEVHGVEEAEQVRPRGLNEQHVRTQFAETETNLSGGQHQEPAGGNHAPFGEGVTQRRVVAVTELHPEQIDVRHPGLCNSIQSVAASVWASTSLMTTGRT